jgi:hypothetical protein
MKSKKYNAQQHGNEDHLHIQEEMDKPALKKAIAKEKQKGPGVKKQWAIKH